METNHTESSVAYSKKRIFLTTEHLTAGNSFRVSANNPQFEAWTQNEILFVKTLENTTPLDDGAYYSTSTENTEDLCVIIPMNLSTADCTYPS